MGGRVGLKGTDGKVEEALQRGAVPVAHFRALQTLSNLRGSNISFLTCSGVMGEEALRESGIKEYRVVYHPREKSTAQDTIAACRIFLEGKISLLLFCGGDGTARDIYSVVGNRVPLLGIPAGVKMHSGVFGVNPAATAEIILRISETSLRESEIVDIDEEEYRKGVLAPRIFGIVQVPYLPEYVQDRKWVYEEASEDRAKAAIAQFITAIMRKDTAYILGAGSTTAEIATHMGLEKTLLGIDVVKGGQVILRDADERGLLSILANEQRVKIIMSPIGAQGFVLGRGTQAISPQVIRAVGPENVIVVATPHKLRETPVLFIDTGEPALDREFGDSILVISGHSIGQRKKLLHPELQVRSPPESFRQDP